MPVLISPLSQCWSLLIFFSVSNTDCRSSLLSDPLCPRMPSTNYACFVVQYKMNYTLVVANIGITINNKRKLSILRKSPLHNYTERRKLSIMRFSMETYLFYRDLTDLHDLHLNRNNFICLF